MTSIVVIVNELKIASAAVASCLNQAHDNFACVSISRGTIIPKASILASSNDTSPHERYVHKSIEIAII